MNAILHRIRAKRARQRAERNTHTVTVQAGNISQPIPEPKRFPIDHAIGVMGCIGAVIVFAELIARRFIG
ncbi:MAG: hypothetical protein KDH20_15860 [Rhodocyclaceae bacterium]|nr:hypothetical protein [Rhodocyclaceae bacterium]